ncbi:signal recognition particle-docking protein FtsY, partial [Xanthomonas campestris pv. cannae]|nr:signal recognition particle-docking protein FtsY [Xanthomonas campestris pv. cannae]
MVSLFRRNKPQDNAGESRTQRYSIEELAAAFPKPASAEPPAPAPSAPPAAEAAPAAPAAAPQLTPAPVAEL